MKAGLRTPSLKRSVKARTTGRVKRAAKSAINPLYGKSGIGYIKNPEKAVKNSIYHKITVDPLDSVKHPHDTNVVRASSSHSKGAQSISTIKQPIISKWVKLLVLFTILFLIALYIGARVL